MKAGTKGPLIHDEATGGRLLGAAEERRLLLQSRSTDVRRARRAAEKLVRHNRRLVAKEVGRLHVPPALEAEDLYQAGLMGLLKAIEKFDLGEKTRFSTYATYWVRQAMRRHLENAGALIRIPVHVHREMAHLRKAEASLAAAIGRTPTAEEVQSESGFSSRQLCRLADAASAGRTPRSLDAEDDDVSSLMERLAGEEPSPESATVAAETGQDLATSLRKAMRRLPKDERNVLRLRFGLGGEELTLRQCGRRLGISAESVRRKERVALEQLERLVTGKEHDSTADAWPEAA